MTSSKEIVRNPCQGCRGGIATLLNKLSLRAYFLKQNTQQKCNPVSTGTVILQKRTSH